MSIEIIQPELYEKSLRKGNEYKNTTESHNKIPVFSKFDVLKLITVR